MVIKTLAVWYDLPDGSSAKSHSLWHPFLSNTECKREQPSLHIQRGVLSPILKVNLFLIIC